MSPSYGGGGEVFIKMKRIILWATMFAATLSLSAQRRMQVWEGNTYMQFFTTDVDSVTFLSFPDGILQECKEIHDTIIKTVTVHDTITQTIRDTIVKDTVYIQYCPDTIQDKPLAGAFSVSATKQVRFSRGNLQYTRSTQTWSFARHQYDMIGIANVTEGSNSYDATSGYSRISNNLADKIDLFGWSSSTATAKWGIGTSQSDSDYSGAFVDWGKNIGDGNIWYTLTYDEWYYLRWNRANANDLVGVARIQLGGGEYANGLILLPDTWTCLEGITFKSGFPDTHSVRAYADYQTFTLADWQELEAAGAVFLPASGCRGGANINIVQYYGVYWSASPNASEYAHCLCFYSYVADTEYGSYRGTGQAVRLVQNLQIVSN